ncbi:pyruvate dehydrogenase complex dihydrolipoamide acetyltransferase [soil metagenome]
MASAVNLLQLSPTMSEGTIVKWLVKEGDSVKSGQAIAEIETDKAVMEQESFEDGKVLKILAKPGQKVPVESLIMVIGADGEDISGLVNAAGAKSAAKAGADAPKAAAKPSQMAPAAKTPAPTRPAAAPEKKTAVPATPAKQATNGGGEGARVFASPLARKVAQDAGLNLGGVQGSGPQGRIIRKDVGAAIAGGGSAAAAESDVIQLSGMRQTIARRLLESKQSIPHFQLSIDVRGEALLAAVAKVKEINPDAKVTVTHFLIKAMAAVAMRHRAVRSQWAGETLNVLPSASISVAVAIEEGLLTPVIRDAQTKGVFQLADELRDLAAKARARKLTAADMSGGVQTISNLGMYGISNFTAIINPPESSILAIGAMEDRPVVEKGAIVPGKVMTITASLDHRVIDGAVGAQYLADLKRTLENPVLMLL